MDGLKTWYEKQKLPPNSSDEKHFIFSYLLLRAVTAEVIHSWRRLGPRVNTVTLGNVESDLWQEGRTEVRDVFQLRGNIRPPSDSSGCLGES